GATDFAVSGDWTPAAGDVKVTQDGGAAANITTLPAAITYGNGALWEFTFTAAEMTAAVVIVTVIDAATKAVVDQAFVLETFGANSAMYSWDPTSSLNVAGIPKVDVAYVNVLAASDMSAKAIVRGTVASGATTTVIPTSTLSPVASDPDQFKGRVLIFDNDTATVGLRGEGAPVQSSSVLGVITFLASDQLSRAPGAGDTFGIY